MIVNLVRTSDPRAVTRELVALGLWVTPLEGGSQPQLRVEEGSRELPIGDILAVSGVESVARPRSAHPRVDAHPPTVRVRSLELGTGAPPVLIAGPCSVESEASAHALAHRVAAAGAKILRGGAYKPRTSPYSFQGHGGQALEWLRAAADSHGLAVVTEVLDPEDAARVAEHADLLQIGSRSMQSSPLLRAAGATGKPVLLKRGMAATVEEWLLAAEHCLVAGAAAVIFCERGVRGFDPSTRNLLDLGAVALLAGVRRLPVIVDPSHAVGRRDLVAPLARAALAAGAAGVMLETHDSPGDALSDGPQALTPAELTELAASLLGARA
ncbi:MAG: 3-deoxy-7-phosphoheptulonate synthase [Polyangiaceae bacterium]|nr:3-deoxy-7-phosphoheptulonate synthase [Polyangiaceae bacterium]